MATVKGQNLRLFIGGVAVAAAQQCDLSLRLNVKTVTTKDDTNDFGGIITTSLSWEVRANGVVTVDPSRNDPSTLLNRIGQTVYAEMAAASGVQNSDKGEIMLSGEAVISDVQITAQNQEESTYSVTLTGKKNMLTDIRLLVTANGHALKTASGHLLTAAHDA